MTHWHLDGRMHLDVSGADRERWAALARAEGLGLSQWIRRILNRAPQRARPLGPDRGPLDHILNIRVNREEKSRWESFAQAEGVRLAAWVRGELNAALL